MKAGYIQLTSRRLNSSDLRASLSSISETRHFHFEYESHNIVGPSRSIYSFHGIARFQKCQRKVDL